MEGGYILLMVDYPDLSSLSPESGISGLMSLPNSSYPYFWAWILGGIWIIMVLTMYFKEVEKVGKGKIISSMAVASLAILLLSTIGTVLNIVSIDIMVILLVLTLLNIAIWFFSSK